MKIRQKPLLSIGIIFKNEIRCIERCLKSLVPLRKAVPCELVMADTGSDDGSCEIAAKYADILFDFPWIDDFAVARNAIMDRCSGVWYLTIDCDEWLDPNIKEIISFMRKKHTYIFGGVIIRNYKSPEPDAGGMYLDSYACRVVKMSEGKRYRGAIHETWDTKGHTIFLLKQTMLHHDGYLQTEGIDQTAKSKRNMRILRKKMENIPDSDRLFLLMQAIESSFAFPDEQLSYIRQGIQGVTEKKDRWQNCGPAILRHAVSAGLEKHLSELEEWIALADKMFPDSIVTRVDVNNIAMYNCWNKKDYAGCIARGEAYLKAVKDYEKYNYNVNDLASSPLSFASGYWQQTARGSLAEAYLNESRFEDCSKTLSDLVSSPLSPQLINQALRILVRLHSYACLDTAQLISDLWDQVNKPASSVEKTQECMVMFTETALCFFQKNFHCEEINGMDMLRPAYTLFLPLEGKCELGNAAAVFAETNPQKITQKLSQVQKWNEFPIHALIYALDQGAAFPPPDKPLYLEEMDILAAKIAEIDEKTVVSLALNYKLGSSVCWDRALVFAAARKINWKDSQNRMHLARRFAEVEAGFLPLCYSSDALTEENLFILPQMHRFGWYLAQVFKAADSGKFTDSIALLRKALETCNDMKPMVEFLSDEIPLLEQEQTMHAASPELIKLAEQVRVILAQYPEDDPAVAQIKSSPVYQRVAWLIETPIEKGYVQ